MALKIALNGAGGRMGRRIADLAANAGHEIVAPVDHKFVGDMYGSVIADNRHRAQVAENYSGGADVLIDFSLPEGFRARLQECVANKTPLVSGTTGLTEHDFKQLDEAAKVIPVLWAPNMSLGVNLLFKLTEEVAHLLGLAYNVEITEIHHNQKKDSPSGTAVRLAKQAAQGLGLEYPAEAVFGREGLVGARPERQIGIHALRGGDVVGEHTVAFIGSGERIELTHKAHSRDNFAQGALRAAHFAASAPPGLYDMQDVLGLR